MATFHSNRTLTKTDPQKPCTKAGHSRERQICETQPVQPVSSFRPIRYCSKIQSGWYLKMNSVLCVYLYGHASIHTDKVIPSSLLFPPLQTPRDCDLHSIYTSVRQYCHLTMSTTLSPNL